MPGFSHLKNELKTNLGLCILWKGICCKSAWSWWGEKGRLTLNRASFSLSSSPSFSASSTLLPLSSFSFIYFVFFFLMGHWKHTHTHTQVEKCLINFYKMNTCVITTEVEKQNSISSRNFPSALSNSKFFHHPRRKCNPQFDHFYLFKGQTQISLLIP